MKPDFLCIGAQKAGTTWLYNILCDHPDFSMPPIKEFHYFDRSSLYPSPNVLSESKLLNRLREPRYSKQAVKIILQSLKALDFRLAQWWFRYYFGDYSDTWYRKLFDIKSKITGDITPSYSILSEKDIARIYKVNPNIKLVFLLRNPIDRAWSMYRFEERLGRSINLSDLDIFIKFIDSPSQELRSNYIRTIDLFLKYFDSSQLLLGFYDAMSDQPAELLSEILRHLGATQVPIHMNLHQEYNKSRQVDIPKHFHEFLENKYHNDLEKLAQRYGGYTTKWLMSIKDQHAEQANATNLPPPVAHP